jgi:hypothetical protein
MKRCPTCGVEKLESEFGIRKSGYRAGQFRGECKPCEKARLANYWAEHKEKRRQLRKAWRKRDRLLHPEKWAAEVKARRARDPEKTNRIAREWRKQNPEKWRGVLHRSNSKPQRRLVNRLRTRINAVLRGRCKSAHTLELLGCSLEHLKVWLAFYFQPGMSFANYGLWHIDHIRPCASFDLSNPVQQRECFHYTNLQPLWAKENMSKGDKELL